MTALTTAFLARVMRGHGYDVREGPETAITGGDADSRRISPGQLFAAYPGDNTDGNLFVEAAFGNGAVAAICSRAPAAAWPERTIVVAPDTTRAAGEFGAAWRAECPGPRVVGITGTVGKTTAKELTADVLSQFAPTHRSEGGLNSRQGLPLAMLSLRPGHALSVLEMGTDSKGEIRELCEMAKPAVGVVLNIGLTHVEKLGSIEAIAEEKLSLPRALPADGTAVLNADDPRIAAAIPGMECRVLSFGAGEGADLRCSRMEDGGLDGTRFTVVHGGVSAAVRSPLPGLHTVPAALTAIGVSLALGYALADAAEAVGRAQSGGRLTVRTSDTGATLLDDRYNSSPASLAGDLDLLAAMKGRRIALLGKMAELGEHEEAEHRKAGERAARSCDVLVAVGPVCRSMAESAKAAGLADVRWFESKEAAAADVRAMLRSGDVVLLKASRSQAFETIIPLLEGRA